MHHILLSSFLTFNNSEVSFESFAVAIEKIRKIYGKPDVGHSGYTGILQQRGGIFYDLGSGTGKAVLAAAIAHEFATCVGIESLEGLFVLSQDLLAAYNNKGKVKLSREYDTGKPTIIHEGVFNIYVYTQRASFCMAISRIWT